MYDCKYPTYTPPVGQGIIYRYELDTGKSYIGQTRVSMYKRHREHIRETHECSHSRPVVDNFLKKHKWKLEILWVGPIEELSLMENKYMDEYNTIWPNGYNFKYEDTPIFSEKKYIAPDYILPTCKKVHMYDYSGMYVRSFDSLSLASQYLGTYCANISKVCGKQHRCVKKHRFVYDGDVFFSIISTDYQKKNTIPIDMIDANTGEVIQTFEGCRDAERKTGVDSSAIVACCRGRSGYMHTGGYVWEYHEPSLKEKYKRDINSECILYKRGNTSYLRSKIKCKCMYQATNINGESITGSAFDLAERIGVDCSAISRKKYQGIPHKKGKLKGWTITKL